MTAGVASTRLDQNWLRDLVVSRVAGTPADARVRRTPLSMVSTSSVVYAVTASTPDGRPLGQHLVLKVPRTADWRHAREVDFYRRLGPRLAGLVPHCYSTADGDGAHLLLEDCSPGRRQHAMDAVPPAAVTTMVRTLARVHARLWQDVPDVPDVPSPPAADDDLSPLTAWRDLLSEADLDRIRSAYARRDLLRSRLSTTTVPCHGDYHSLNVFVGTPDAVVIDWQDWYPGNPAEDLARLVTTYVHPLDRRRHERRWLDCYARQLRDEGVSGYDLPRLRSNYRVAVELALLNPLRLLAVHGLHPDNALARTKNALLAAEDVLGR